MPSFLSGYNQRIAITIDHTQVGASDLTDFPLRLEIELAAGAPPYVIAGELLVADGSLRIALTAGDGTTLLPFEVDNAVVLGGGAGTVTADAAADTITAGTSRHIGEAVQFTTTGTLPGGLSAATYYWVLTNSNTFQVSATRGGPPVNITSAGSGTHSLTTYSVRGTSGSESGIWVKPSTISHTSDTTIYLYYDHTQADASAGYNPTSVWNSDYKGVWHGEQTPTGSASDILDSTGNANHGTSQGSMGALVTGEIGNALNFDGSNDYVSLPEPGITGTSMSGSLWLYQTSTSGFDRGIFYFGPFSLRYAFTSTDYVFTLFTGQTGSLTSLHPLTINAWNQVVVTTDGSTIGLYVNGALVVSGATSGTLSTGSNNYLGYSGTDAFQGPLDEARASTVCQSADWIAFEYTNIASNASTIAFGDEETAGSPASGPFPPWQYHQLPPAFYCNYFVQG